MDGKAKYVHKVFLAGFYFINVDLWHYWSRASNLFNYPRSCDKSKTDSAVSNLIARGHLARHHRIFNFVTRY